MSRIFVVLAGLSLALLLSNLIVGLTIGDLQQVAQQRKAADLRLKQLQRERQPESGNEIKAARSELTKVMTNTAPVSRHVALHILLGVLAALVTVLVNSISVTYFIGTSRWCKEVVDTYALDPALIQQSRRIKRQSFPWSLGGMLVTVGIIALGAASDPGTSVENSAQFVTPHLLAALVGTAFIGWSFLMQLGKMTQNHLLIGQVMDAVQHIRRERGMND